VSIDELEGRELDAAVATQLFGLVAEARVNTRTRERDAVCRLPNGDWVRVAFYSERMGPCLNVEAWLREQGWAWIAPTGRAPLGEVEVVYRHVDGRTLMARGRLNEAVCRAALKTVQQV
jgi:hypothetical protein